MKLLLTVAGPLAFEEALFARRFLQQLPESVEALVLCHVMTGYYLVEDLTRPDACPWGVVLWGDSPAERDHASDLAHAFDPDLVVVGDPGTIDSEAGRMSLAWLRTFDVPILAIDSTGNRHGLAADAWLQACPPLEPGKGLGHVWQPFGGIEGTLRRYEMREALLGRHQADPDSLIVMLPFSLPIQVMAGVRMLKPWYPTMIDTMSYHLQQLGRPVLFVVTTPGCPQTSETRGSVQLAIYDDFIVPLMERYLAAADLVIVEQSWRFWRYQALAQGIPVAVMANSLGRADDGPLMSAFGQVHADLLPLLDRLETEAAHALAPFQNFPVVTDAWASEAYVPELLWARLDLFDAGRCATVLHQLLSPEELPRWEPAVSDFLSRGRSDVTLIKTLKQVAGPSQLQPRG